MGSGVRALQSLAEGALAPPETRFMRLKPPPPVDEIYHQLAVAATMSWGITDAARIEPHLRSIANAMATVAALDIPDDTEPLFGEDIGLDVEVLP